VVEALAARRRELIAGTMAHSRGLADSPQERLLTSGRVVRGAFPGSKPSGFPPVSCRLQQRACDGFTPSSVFRG